MPTVLLSGSMIVLRTVLESSTDLQNIGGRVGHLFMSDISPVKYFPPKCVLVRKILLSLLLATSGIDVLNNHLFGPHFSHESLSLSVNWMHYIFEICIIILS